MGWNKWILVQLVIVLALAGCTSPATPTVSTPTAPVVSAPTPTAEPPVPVDPDQVMVLFWQREGGIAGFCDQVTVYAGGRVMITSCQEDAPRESRLSGAELEQVTAWVKALRPFEHVQTDGAVADSMTVHLSFAGQGTQTATEVDMQAMRDLAAALALLPEPLEAWPVLEFPTGISVAYPPEWIHEPVVTGETQTSVWFHPPEADGPPVAVEIYYRPQQDYDLADPFTWMPNQGGYQVEWSRPITTVQGWAGIEFVWAAYQHATKNWETSPQLMVIYYSAEHELDVRLTTPFDRPALDLLVTADLTDTVTAGFDLFHRMARSVTLHPDAGE
ncbi:MAG: hypothetical protein JXM73_23390 [Anaerolineae bacterium]|nr:hypothetical protein [Anaerolineae bacterium]